MRKRRALKPVVQPLEDRTVLSFSFSNLLHSILPFIHSGSSNSSKPASHMTAAQRSDMIQKRWEAKTISATRIVPTGHISTAKIHSKPLQEFLDRHRVG